METSFVGNRNATVWPFMVIAVGIHVIDEALTDFLGFYNPLVSDLRTRFRFFPMPTFTFPVWIAGLTLAVSIGLALTSVVRRGGRVIRVVCGVLALLMIANACGHHVRIALLQSSSPWILEFTLSLHDERLDVYARDARAVAPG